MVTQDSIVTSTDYLSGFQYVTSTGSVTKLAFFPTAEGYVEPTETGGYQYVYNYTDHLGNNRLSYIFNTQTSSLQIREENNYYPFGLKQKGYNDETINSEYKYKYNGQEYQDELGLNMYDYGARNYDAALGRWMNLDPFGEFMRNQSPYNYSFNNPIYFSDFDGSIPWPVPEMFNKAKRRIGDKYGKRIRNGKEGFHHGIEINLGSAYDDYGTPVLATHSGKVIRITPLSANNAEEE